MSVWAIANQKGGVGKTTTTISLAGLGAAANGRQLLIDLDPHASLTAYLGFDPEGCVDGIYSLFRAAGDPESGAVDAAEAVRRTRLEGIDLLPAHPALATLDRAFGNRPGMGRVVARAIERLGDRYEEIFIDCPPMLGVLMVNALAACDHFVVPVQTEFLALKGLERMLVSLEMIERSLRRRVPYTIVPTLYDRRTRASCDALDVLHLRYRRHLTPEPIPVDTRFREASERGVPLTMMAPTAHGSVAYADLMTHLRGQLAAAALAERSA